MSADPLKKVADAVVRRAKQQGYVVPRDVRSELRLAGQDESQWKKVLEHASNQLAYRQGRYHAVQFVSPTLQEANVQMEAVRKAVRQLIRKVRAKSRPDDRRAERRLEVAIPVEVRTEVGRKRTVLCRDLSAGGIRLLGVMGMLGQLVTVSIKIEGEAAVDIVTRVVWTWQIGDDLFENGGTFLRLASS